MGVCELEWLKAMLKTDLGAWSAGSYEIRQKNTFIEIVPSAMSKRRSKSQDSRSSRSSSPPSSQGSTVHEPKCDDESCKDSNEGFTCEREFQEEKRLRFACAMVSDATRRVHWRYVHNKDDAGVTIMWHGIPSKCTAESDLLPMLDALAPDHQYVYLPMNQHSKSHRSTKCRNKGYAFVHFADESAAQAFEKRVEQGLSMCKKTSTTLAAFQGISANLAQLFAAPKTRTTDSIIYVRFAGRMERVGVHELASLSCF